MGSETLSSSPRPDIWGTLLLSSSPRPDIWNTLLLSSSPRPDIWDTLLLSSCPRPDIWDTLEQPSPRYSRMSILLNLCLASDTMHARCFLFGFISTTKK